MPGSSLPSSSSSDAPPPVETHETRSARPSSWIALTESPPPTTEYASALATASATARVPAANALPLEHAHRAVPEDRFRASRTIAAYASRARADVEPQPAVGDPSTGTSRASASAANALAATTSVGSSHANEVDCAPADLLRHLAADQHRVGAAAEVLEHGQLVVDLRAACDQHERALDLAEKPAEVLELREQERPA